MIPNLLTSGVWGATPPNGDPRGKAPWSAVFASLLLLVGVVPSACSMLSESAPAAVSGPRAGDSFRDCPQCPEMVVVPAGSYRMGSPSYEQGRGVYEGRGLEVTIAAPFAIGRHEVTVAEFGRFVDETGYWTWNSCLTYEGGKWESRAGRGWRNPGFGQSGRHPVACVNWNEAQAYIAWLSRETGEEYRLPGEAEWEYAARARSETMYHFGDDETLLCKYGNVADKTPFPNGGTFVNGAACRDGNVYTTIVGSYLPNAFGLHDVVGNVWEWMAECWGDCWDGSDAGVPADERAGETVVRGGSWSSTPGFLRRSASRRGITTGRRDSSMGFRVARTLAP